jgi:hypothetical protein
VPYTVFDADAEGRRRRADPTIIIQPDLRVRLSAEAAEILRAAGATRVLVMWDQAARKLALATTPDTDRRGYRLGYGKRGGAKFTAKVFLKKIGWNQESMVRLTAHMTKGMLETVIPAGYLDPGPREKASPRVRRKKPEI